MTHPRCLIAQIKASCDFLSLFQHQERQEDFEDDAIEKIKEFMVEQSSRTVEERFAWEEGDASLPSGWKMR